MSNTKKITKDGWTRDFFSGSLKAALAEAEAYVDGIHDAAPGEFETDFEDHDRRITVTVRKKLATP